MSKDNKEEIKDELNDEILTEEETNECDCCSHDHEHCDCGCEEYDFEPIHKKGSCANIFSIISKVIAVMCLIIGTYSYVDTVFSYNEMYGAFPSIIEVVYGYLSSILLIAFAFFGIGEVINLINRIKESIMY